jgi:hypothetical protein
MSDSWTLRDDRRDNRKTFDTRADAEDARDDLLALGATADDLEIVPPAETDGSGATTPELVEQPGDSTDELDVNDVGAESFVVDVKGVPNEFVLELGGETHVRKAGYYKIAADQGLEWSAEAIQRSFEGDDDERAVYEGVVRDPETGQEWRNVGTAHLDGEDMDGAEHNLDELAATRACCRALSMATGVGLTSVEEMAGGDQ